MWSGGRTHLHRDQHLQQGCRVTDGSRDGDECFGDDGMFFCQQVETFTHVVELLSFVQDRVRMHGGTAF